MNGNVGLKWMTGGSGGSGTIDSATVAGGGTVTIDGTLAGTNVTLTGSATIASTMPSNGWTTVRVIQGGSGGYTPTFSGCTWVSDQPVWSTQVAGTITEVQISTIDGTKTVAWGYDIPSLQGAMRTWRVGQWACVDALGVNTVTSPTSGRAVFWRMDLRQRVTFDAWAYEITTGATVGGSTMRVAVGFCTSVDGAPSALIGEMDADSIAAATVLGTGNRSLGPGGAGAGFTAANATTVAVGPGTVFAYCSFINAPAGIALRGHTVINRTSSATLTEVIGSSLSSLPIFVVTGLTGAMPASPTVAIAGTGVPRVALRVSAVE